MFILHWISGLLLIVITVGVAVHSVTRFKDPEERDPSERMALYGFLIGLPWAAVLFTGFFQLGSVMEFPDHVVAKFIATMAGGLVSIGVLILGAAGVLNRRWLGGVLLGAAVLFSLSGYWGLLT